MVPPETDPRWVNFVTNTRDYELSCLATRIMHGQVKLIARKDVDMAVRVAREFFIRNELLASEDLRAVMGRSGQ